MAAKVGATLVLEKSFAFPQAVLAKLTAERVTGFPLVPLGHAGVIQPSCAALIGLLLAVIVLKEKLPVQRAFGDERIAAVILSQQLIGKKVWTK